MDPLIVAEQVTRLNLKPVPDYDGYYVSQSGTVYSSKSKTKELKRLTANTSDDGYCRTTFTCNGKSKIFYIHRIVAFAWLPPPLHDNYIVNHIDGNKANPSATNLEWISPSQNCHHAIKTGLISEKRYPIYQISTDGVIVAEHNSKRDAAAAVNGILPKISMAINGLMLTYSGFFWRIKKEYNSDTFTMTPPIGKFDSNRNDIEKRLIATFSTLEAASLDSKLDKTATSIQVLNKKSPFTWRYLVHQSEILNPEIDTNNWKRIKDYPNYFISRDGRIYSVFFRKELNHFDSNGRQAIKLRRFDGVIKKQYLHRLVADAFIANPNNHDIVNHMDGNPCNNHVSNLEWCTQSDNVNHAHDTGLTKTRKRIIQYTIDNVEIQRFISISEAARQLNYKRSTFYKALSGVCKTAKGFIWKYE